jgi:assimilatory nitrate reductase electron transfer subunit
VSAGRVRVVVVGNGMAGSRIVQELLERDLDRRLHITVIGDEPGGAYNRMQLSNVLAGKTRSGEITLASEAWYAGHDVTLLAGTEVLAVDRYTRTVAVAGRPGLRYDVLVLATGSHAVIPPVEGLRDGNGGLIPGAVLFRTLADCAEIDRRAQWARHALVLGGGLLGLEAARGLAGRGVAVTVVQRGARLMEQQLDDGASAVLLRTMRKHGIEVVTEAAVRGVRGDNAVAGVALADGTEIDADLLVLCCGVRPRVELARAAGLAVGRGVIVDDQLRSVSDRDIHAVGECAEHDGRTYGLVAPAWEQARVAADAITGRTARYAGSAVVTRLKAAGVELAAMGQSVAEDVDDIRFVDGGRGVYQKLVVRDGRLVGAILLGDTRTVGSVTQLFDRGAALPPDRASLLMVRRNAPVTTVQSPTTLPGAATICHCNGVTKAGICDAWQAGARSVDEVAARSRATTGCGTCRDAVQGLVDWLAASDAGVDDAPVDDAPVDDAPVDDAPVDDAPVDAADAVDAEIEAVSV